MSTECQDQVEQSVAERLAKLRTMPVDTSRMDKSIAAQIPQLQSHSRRRILSLRPLRAVAASLLLLCGIAVAILLTVSSRPADAEAAQMAQVHEDMVAGRIPVMQVASIDAANRMLNSQSPGAPSLPNIPDSHVMACCMKSVHNKKMACVLLKDANEPVTLAVASAADMKLTPAPIETRNGVDYRVEHVGGLNMVMTERDGKWLCLIGRLPVERLMDVASQVQF
jgi:hypothetical protein